MWVEMCVRLFKMCENMLELIYQTPPKFFLYFLNNKYQPSTQFFIPIQGIKALHKTNPNPPKKTRFDNTFNQ